ncbi:putative membrane protein YdfK [bioreactor metagenome]|uniref:Putative membrane protein YdfK n=1 Tax=bioreactor metagenome TaxID=1076179 RepID=A0A645DQJ7_9ZZZZ
MSEGFVTASLLFCIGAMTIVGSLNAGLAGDNKMLFTKSVLDFVSSIMLSVSLGIGVLCSAAFVLVFQGAIVLLAQFIAPILTDSAIAEMTCAGSIMIIGLSLNILGLTKLKTANMLPALVVVPIVCYIFSILPFNI